MRPNAGIHPLTKVLEIIKLSVKTNTYLQDHFYIFILHVEFTKAILNFHSTWFLDFAKRKWQCVCITLKGPRRLR